MRNVNVGYVVLIHLLIIGLVASASAQQKDAVLSSLNNIPNRKCYPIIRLAKNMSVTVDGKLEEWHGAASFWLNPVPVSDVGAYVRRAFTGLNDCARTCSRCGKK